MSADFDSVSSATQPTTLADKKIYEIVVDPDRAHLGESFVIDMRKLGSALGPKEKAVDDKQKAAVVENLMKFSASGPTISPPKKVGRAIPNIPSALLRLKCSLTCLGWGLSHSSTTKS